MLVSLILHISAVVLYLLELFITGRKVVKQKHLLLFTIWWREPAVVHYDRTGDSEVCMRSPVYTKQFNMLHIFCVCFHYALLSDRKSLYILLWQSTCALTLQVRKFANKNIFYRHREEQLQSVRTSMRSFFFCTDLVWVWKENHTVQTADSNFFYYIRKKLKTQASVWHCFSNKPVSLIKTPKASVSGDKWTVGYIVSVNKEAAASQGEEQSCFSPSCWKSEGNTSPPTFQPAALFIKPMNVRCNLRLSAVNRWSDTTDTFVSVAWPWRFI